jgi:hypothetical protein
VTAVIVVIAVHGPPVAAHRPEKRDPELYVETMCEKEDRGMSEAKRIPR